MAYDGRGKMRRERREMDQRKSMLIKQKSSRKERKVKKTRDKGIRHS